MPATQKLKAQQVRHSKEGKLSDGGGLFLVTRPTGARFWVVRVTLPDGTRRDLGAGSYPDVSLRDARKRAAVKHAEAAAETAPTSCSTGEAPVPTFAEAAAVVLELLTPTWRNERAPTDWRRSLERHAASIMSKPLDQITRIDVLDIVEPLSLSNPRTGNVVRARIRKVFAHAMGRDERITVNPAGEMLDGALVARAKCARKHHRSIAHDEVAEALAIVDRSGAAVATRLALRFLTLTAVRSVEAREAVWSEIDTDTGTWSIPADRMKTAVAQRVALSRQALDVLDAARDLPNRGGSDLVFPSRNGIGRPVTNQALRGVLDDNAIDCSPHGMRSSFRQWAAETAVPRELAESALAHAIGDQTERAYTRDFDYLEPRRPVMQDWADYAAPEAVR